MLVTLHVTKILERRSGPGKCTACIRQKSQVKNQCNVNWNINIILDTWEAMTQFRYTYR